MGGGRSGWMLGECHPMAVLLSLSFGDVSPTPFFLFCIFFSLPFPWMLSSETIEHKCLQLKWLI